MSPEVAQELAQWTGNHLDLSGLTTLSGDVALELAQWQGEGSLVLDGLATLSPEAAKGLSQWNAAELRLRSLRELSPEAAEELLPFFDISRAHSSLLRDQVYHLTGL